MNKNNLLYGIVGLIFGLIIGFFVSNNINRNAQITELPSQPNAPFQNPQTQNALVKDQPTKSGMLPDVAAVIDRATQNPNDFDAQIKAGDMYSQIKGFEKAAAFYEQANKLKPEDYSTIVKIGNTYFDAEQFEKAEKWYEQALAIKPDDTNVRTDLGITFVERSNPDYDRAVKEFQTSLQTNPKHEPTIYNLGVAQFKKGNLEETNEALNQLEQINPNSQLADRLKQLINPKN